MMLTRRTGSAKRIFAACRTGRRHCGFRRRIDRLVDAAAAVSSERVTNLVQNAANAEEKLREALVPSEETVFANSVVRMGDIKVVGFDFDYTLVHYTSALNHLLYDLALEVLVQRRHYPPELLSDRICRSFDKNLAVRGLSIDTRSGAIVKLSYRHQMNPSRVYMGHRRLEAEEAVEHFGGSVHISVQTRDAHFKPVVDLFLLSEAALLTNVLDAFHRWGVQHDAGVVLQDITHSVREVHLSGEMHRRVLSDPEQYIDADGVTKQRLRAALVNLRSSGKKLFISSNSPYRYVACGMHFMLGDDWADLFDVVIASAQKPSFYSSDKPFRRLEVLPHAHHPPEVGDDLTGGRIAWEKVTSLEKGSVYTSGSISEFVRLTGWNGPDVLYFGDSLWADLVDARRIHGWTTAAVVAEVEKDMGVQRSEEYTFLFNQVALLRELLRLVQREMIKSREERAELASGAALLPEETQLLETIEDCVFEVTSEMADMSHPRWGSVFRTERHQTLFSFSLQRFVDLYTARVENLADYTPEHIFFPSARSSDVAGMAHDITGLSQREVASILADEQA